MKEALGVPWDRVHEEAEKWEHVLSEDLEDRIDEFLGRPTSDPHGSPIPDRNGKMIERECKNLIEVSPKTKAIIVEVSDHNSELLRYFGSMQLYPEAEIKILSVEPFHGPIRLYVKGEEYSIGREVAKYISVVEVGT